MMEVLDLTGLPVQKSRALLGVSILLVIFGLAGCGLISSDTLFGGVDYTGKLKEYTNDALKVAFKYPETNKVTVQPGDDDIIAIKEPGGLEINLRVLNAQDKSAAEFTDRLKQSYDTMPANTNGFQEYQRKFFTLGGCPAAYIEYKWNVMRNDFRVMQLEVLKGNNQYVLLTTYLLKDDAQYQKPAQVVFDSFNLLEGNPDITALKAETIGGTAPGNQGTGTVPLPPTNNGGGQANDTAVNSNLKFAITKKSCFEGNVTATIKDEFGANARIADWSDLKSQYGVGLVGALEDLGLKDGQLAWLALNGQELYSGNRHYFIQRFDLGKPEDFLAHDTLAPIYLGSWYGLEIPVLVCIDSSAGTRDFAITADATFEGTILNIVNSEFGDKARLADWTELKNRYGAELPSYLNDIGLKNEQALWLVCNGQEMYTGNRHFFIQRFDNGKPAEFLAHDSIGPIYLGSWYGLQIPVLVKTQN
jgi:hypothetical protein